MSQILLMALAVSLPLALLAFAAAWAVEAMGAGVKLRLCAWTAALLLPALPAPAMLAIHGLGVPSPFAALQAEPVVALVDPTAVAVPLPAPKLESEPPPAHIPWVPLALGLIGAGAALRLGQLALGLRRVARLKAASEPISDPDVAAQLGHGVRLADTRVPVLAGLIRPTILLPRRLLGGLSAEQAVLVCAHERAHLAAGDHLSHLMEETMVRLYWFNPLMAAARERLAAAREEACDARALAGCDERHRREYARTLLAALKLSGPAEPVAAFTGFRRRGAERRLKAILKPTGPGSWRAAAIAVLAGLGLVAVAGGVSLAAAAEPTDVSSSPPPPPPALAAPASPGPPASPVGPRRHHTMFYREDGDGIPHAKVDGRTVVINGDDWGLDGDAVRGLTPEEKAELQAEFRKAHEDIAKAMAKQHAAMAGAHKQLIITEHDVNAEVEAAMEHARVAMKEADDKGRQEIFRMSAIMPDGRHDIEWSDMTPEQRAKVRTSIDEAMKHAELAIGGPDDGRVPMRCKLGPDGKGTDCVPFRGPVTFGRYREGPPAPPAPPAPATLPGPPSAG